MQKLMYIVEYDYLNETHTEITEASPHIEDAIIAFNDLCEDVQDEINRGENTTDYVHLYSALCEVDEQNFIDETLVINDDIQCNDYTSFLRED